MGWSFRKSIKLGKGTRLNLSKSGVGLSTGIKGLRVSTGSRGTRITAGIPGSGIYYSKTLGKGKSSQKEIPKEASFGFTFYFIIFLFLILVVFKQIILFLILAICFIVVRYIKFVNRIEEAVLNDEFSLKELSQEKINIKKKKALLLENIDEKILQEIESNNGILQKDLFLLFDPDIKYSISRHLIAMEKSGQIKRIRYGNTYQLYIN